MVKQQQKLQQKISDDTVEKKKLENEVLSPSSGANTTWMLGFKSPTFVFR